MGRNSRGTILKTSFIFLGWNRNKKTCYIKANDHHKNRYYNDADNNDYHNDDDKWKQTLGWKKDKEKSGIIIIYQAKIKTTTKIFFCFWDFSIFQIWYENV